MRDTSFYLLLLLLYFVFPPAFWTVLVLWLAAIASCFLWFFWMLWRG